MTNRIQVSLSILVFSGYVPWSGIAGHILALFLVFKVISRRGCGEKGTLLHYWWECKLTQPPWKTVERVPKKLGTKLPYDPAIPVLGIYLEKTIIQNDICTPVLIFSPQCSLQHYLQSSGHRVNQDVH